MCGIAGMILREDSAVTSEQKAVIATCLFSHMQERGRHSWGYYLGNEQYLHKGVGLASYGVDMTDFTDTDMFMLHTRHATVGDISKENSHPWRFIKGTEEEKGKAPKPITSLIGMHNGCIINHKDLNEKYKRTFEVDSMHIFEQRLQGLSWNELRGYGALACYHETDEESPEREGSLYLGRFNNGVLSIYGIRSGIKDDNRDLGIIFASTAEACRIALYCAGFTFSQIFPYNVEQDRLYKVLNGTNEDGMLWYESAPNDKIDIQYYARQTAAQGEWMGYNNRATTHNRVHDRRSTRKKSGNKVDFEGLSGWQLAKCFSGVRYYTGQENCSKCEAMGSIEMLEEPNERFCRRCWLVMVIMEDPKVVPIGEILPAIEEARTIFKAGGSKTNSGLLCEICDKFEASHLQKNENTLTCAACVEIWEGEFDFTPITDLGKVDGDGSTGCVSEESEGDQCCDGTEEKSGESSSPVAARAISKTLDLDCEECMEVAADWEILIRYHDERGSLRQNVCRECIKAVRFSLDPEKASIAALTLINHRTNIHNILPSI